jgi:DNA polymerase-4
VAAAALLHADLDAFYVSVEQLLDPSLRDRPVAVGGGVVLAASYEARAYGVQGGMPGRLAKQLCPHLRFVPGHFTRYQQLADQVFEICRDFTPAVERISIDEAFLDVSGSERLLGPAASIAASIRRRVRDEVGLPLSVGVARTKHLAKIASQVAKPDGLVVVEPERETEFLRPLPVHLIWGVGPVTRQKLMARGILTIGELADVSPRHLQQLLGPTTAGKLTALARNQDPRSVQTPVRVKSISSQAALGRRLIERDLVERTVLQLADRVCSRMRAKQRAGRRVSVRVRFADLRSVSRAVTLPAPASTTALIAAVAGELVWTALADHHEERQLTLLALEVAGLVAEPPLQMELPLDLPRDPLRPGSPRVVERWAVERAVDRVRERFGRSAVGYASVELEGGAVPEQFRELAQREL